MRYGVAAALAGMAALGAWAPAHAEVLKIVGLAPATNDRAAALKSIVVEEFGGNEGPVLAIRVEDVLRQASIGNGPYFRILPSSAGGEGQGLLRGTADSDVRLVRYTQDREKCTAKDQAGKCTERKKVKVDCARRTMQLSVMLRLVDREGQLLLSEDRPETLQDSYCDDDEKSPRTRSDMVREMASKVAARLRTDFAPALRSDEIRVDEGRKGLSKEDGERVKSAIRLTKTDPAMACALWKSLGEANPSHVPTQYNVGLCAEQANRDDEARQAYRAVQQIEPGNAAAQRGMLRLDSRARAKAQVAAHERG